MSYENMGTMSTKVLSETLNFRFLNILCIQQGVLNDLQSTKLSCGRMIRLLAHPLSHPFPLSKLSLFLSLLVCRRSSLLTGEGACARSKIIRSPRKPGTLQIIHYSLVYSITTCRSYSILPGLYDKRCITSFSSS